MKTLKEKVLEASYKAKERGGIAGKVMDNGWMVMGYGHEHHYQKGGVHLVVKPETPENDEVWPLAAQVLGVGVEMNFTDALNIFAMAKKAYKMGVENATLAGIDHDKTIEAWFKKQIGI